MSRVTDRLNRREVLGGLGALGLTGIGVALAPETQHAGRASAAESIAPSAAGHAEHGGAVAFVQSDGPTVEEMDAMHEEGVRAFPAETNGKGGLPLEYTMDGDVKVFD
ncbi:MAG: hypothetical protein KC438_00640, partial [Thermomicrobiales bacterium]|nr:hypothetical protein [Thermomicrobiales bacterium]